MESMWGRNSKEGRERESGEERERETEKAGGKFVSERRTTCTVYNVAAALALLWIHSTNTQLP